VAVAVFVVSCTRPDPATVKQLADLQTPSGGTSKEAKQTVGELKAEVAKYQSEVNKVFENTQKLGRLYQILGLKYFNSEMYGPALTSFKSAIQNAPTNPVLQYMAGICQGQLAKVETNPQTQRSLYEETAAFYQNALRIDGKYTDALYALSVVDVFELDKAAEAEPLLKRLVSIDPKDANAQFLLARVYVSGGHPEEAAKVYDQIIAGGATAEQKTQAEANKKQVLEGAFGK
jgi:tetratricopeptide (TPR) repeat protein